MTEFSGVIITYNEEQKVRRCIQSLRRVAAEIVVLDSFSTDRTRDICLEEGVRFYQRAFTTYADQRNFATQLAKYDCILSLDADEYLSAKLEKSILSLKKPWKGVAYKMSRLSSYGGQWVKHGSWYPDCQLRLWNRRDGQWGGSNPHERLLLGDHVQIKKLKGDILHESYEDSAAALSKIQLYSTLYAQHRAGQKPSVIGIIGHSAFAFFKSYFFKLGFMDGFAGLAVSVALANHTFYKYAKLLELSAKGCIVIPYVPDPLPRINGSPDVLREISHEVGLPDQKAIAIGNSN